MKKIFFLALCCCLSFLFLSRGEARELKIDAYLDKDFGYFIGDLISVRYEIFLPEGAILNESKLPPAGEELAPWLELRSIKIKDLGGSVYELTMTYQLFAPGSLEKPVIIPGLEFFYSSPGSTKVLSASLPNIPIWIAPLTDKNSRLKPCFFREFTGISPVYFQMGAGGLLVFSIFLFVFGLQNYFRPSPVGKAWKELKKAEYLKQGRTKEALRIFRWMLNEKSGRAIFAGNLSTFFETMPRAHYLKEELEKILVHSDKINFCPAFHFEDEDSVFGEVKALLKKMRGCEK